MLGNSSYSHRPSVNRFENLIFVLRSEAGRGGTLADGIARIRQAQIDLPDLISLRPDLYFCGGTYLRLSLSMHSQPEARAINIANAIPIKSAPLLIDDLAFANGESLLITHIPNCGRSVPARVDSDTPPFSRSQSSGLLKDIKDLLSAGYVHDFALRGRGHWMIHPTDHHILLDGWESLRHAKANEERQVLTKVRDLLR